MAHLTALSALMTLLGFALHFLSRWAEFWKTGEKLGPLEYARLDPPAWVVASVATVATLLVLPELATVFGLTIHATPLGALTAGYMGSSLGGKLPGLFGGLGGVR